MREDFVDPAQWRVFPGVFPALDGLSSRGWTHLVLPNHVPELSNIAGGLGLGERVLRVFNSAETGYEKPHPEAYRRVLRTLGDEVEAVRRVVGAGREEVLRTGTVRQPRLARISPRPVTSDSRPVSPCSEPPTKEET